MSSSIWGKIEKPEVNLQEIMCEQITTSIVQKKESEKVKESDNSKESLKVQSDIEYHDDNLRDAQNSRNNENDQKNLSLNLEHANMHQFYQENVDSKCSNETDYIDISGDDDDESPEDLEENKDWEWFEFVEENLGLMPSILKYNINTTSKQDEEANKKKCTILPSLTNSTHKSECSTHYNRTSTNFASLKFEENTTQLLYKMFENDILEGFDYVIYTGKKTRLLVGEVSPKFKCIQGYETCVIKVFQNMSLELEQPDILQRQIRNKMAEKEMLILCRLKRAGIPCPEVLMLKDNVLVMSLIGMDYWAAVNINNEYIETKNFAIAYNQVQTIMKTLYQKARLVHGRLSSEKVLWHNGQCYFTGFRRAVDVSHKKASYLLYKDCKYIIKFFKSKLDNVTTPDKLYDSIVGPIHEISKQISTAKHHQKLIDHFQKKNIEKFENISKLLFEK